METCCSNEGRTETIETKPVCCKGSDVGSRTPDSGTAGQPLEPSEVSAVPLEQQPPGKQKKTPFKFFGVRKSICTLPSFFGGRNKSQGKGALKKGLCKSKTHDCISDVTYGEAKRGPLGNISNGATVLNQHENRGARTLPSSQSAHMAIEANLDFNDPRASSWGSTGGLDTKQKEEKLSPFPKAKKGLKGLFSGMRRHKKSKALNSDKVEPHEMVILPVSVDQVNKKPRTEPAVEQGYNDLSPMGNAITTVCIESPSKKKTVCKIKKLSETNIADKISDLNVISEKQSETGHVVVSMTESDILDVKLDAIGCEHSDYSSVPSIVNPDPADNEPASTHSADRISLFDDVSSLKSFDSLTGCGDIIADQDIDSIAESTISVERSRELAKRSSCLVTYQGGGEEMATPDEVGDECLQQLWESAAEGDTSCEMKASQSEDGPDVRHEPDPPSHQEEITHLCTEEAAVYNVDLLTPQSDQQRSAPNSDEGYYDSTTPGPDDEAGDSLSHDFKKDRLPRDSYSGDALYEFYEPDDGLMSPPSGGTSLFENEAYCPEIFDHFLDGSLPSDMNFMEIIGQKMGAMETEEDRLAAIQKQILHWELKREPVLKNTELVSQEKCTKGKQNVECKNGTAVSVGRKQSCVDSEQVASRTSSRTSINSAFPVPGTEHTNWGDFQEMPMPCSNTFYNGSCDQRAVGNCHVQVTKNSYILNSDLDSSVFGANDRSSSGTYPNIRKAHHGSCMSSELGDDVVETNLSNMRENECEQAVSFSQALVDFTSNGTLFSSLSESLGSSDSGSSFTQNLITLPTMVNFDIADVENEGEGEFDQQIEMSAEEELNASFEDFESSYVQKESFAECDEEMFHMDPQSALQNCNWGVASLPRHLSLYRLGSSVPARLSLNRRSRSLDTESLELELANLHLSKSGLRSCDLPLKREDKKDVLFYELGISKERAQLFYSEGREAAEDSTWLRPLHFDAGLSPDEERWDLVENVGTAVLGSDLHTSVPCEIDTQGHDRKVFERRPENRGASNPSPRQMVRPSNLPLQSNGRQSPEVSSSSQYYSEHMKKKHGLALPFEEQKGDCTPRFCFPQSSQNQTKCKPIGITQGMPQFNPNGTETLKHSANYAERFESPHKGMQKGRIEQVKTIPTSWSNNYSECQSNHMVSFSYGGGGED